MSGQQPRGGGGGRRRAVATAQRNVPGRSSAACPGPGQQQQSTGRPVGRAAGSSAAPPPLPAVQKKVSPPAEHRGSPPEQVSPQQPSEADLLVEQTRKLAISQVSLKPRPGVCSAGRPFPVLTNHFRIKFGDQQLLLERYRIDIEHQRRKPNKEAKRHIFWALASQQKEAFGYPYGIAFDGDNNVFAVSQFRLTGPEVVSHTAFFKQLSVLQFVLCLMNGDDEGQGVGGGGRGGRGGGPGARGGRGGGRGGYGGGGDAGRSVSLNDLARIRLQELPMAQLSKELRGLRIVTKHTAEPREYKVSKLMTVPANAQMFETTDADGNTSTMSVADYFEQRYGRLKYPNLPCLHVGPTKKNIYLPMECCDLKNNQKSNKKLDEDMTTRMIRFACQNAVTRKQQIMEMIGSAKFHEDPWLKTFGLQFDPQMIKATARQLDPPKMHYRNNQAVQPVDGVWNNRGDLPYFQPGSIKCYGLLSFLPLSRSQRELEGFCSKLGQTANYLGMGFPEFPDKVFEVRDPSQVIPAMKSMQEQLKNELDLVICVLPGKFAEHYGEVKKAAEIKLGIMTQCVVQRTVRNCSPATLSNLLNKINTKINGVNMSIAPTGPWQNLMLKTPTLILGLDCSHPGPSDRKSPSVAAIVGNVDLEFHRFHASVKLQKERREHIIHLVDLVEERLSRFYKCTGRKPERIIVYRDGVSDGQFRAVLYEEMTGIRKACEKIETGYKPPITFIIVQKRHHTRFFCENPKDQRGKAMNIPPGTLVDTEIVHPEYFDFFLCSHFGIMGTSRPAKYVVIHDDSNFPENAIQMISFYLCHIYCRCARSVSIPAPVYYADLVCTRARAHLHDIVARLERDASSSEGTDLDDGRTADLSEEDLHQLMEGVNVTTDNGLRSTMYYV